MEEEPLCDIKEKIKPKRGRPCKKKKVVEEHEDSDLPMETMEEIPPYEVEELIKPKLKRTRTSAQIAADKKTG